ncbi:unnamed protein product [Bubo scandiacus]
MLCCVVAHIAYVDVQAASPLFLFPTTAIRHRLPSCVLLQSDPRVRTVQVECVEEKTEPGVSEAHNFREFQFTEEMNIHQHSCCWKGSYGSSSHMSFLCAGSNQTKGVCWILLNIGFHITGFHITGFHITMRDPIQDEDISYIHWLQGKFFTSLQNLASQRAEEELSSKWHPPKPTSKKGAF